jgi:hypothetical protein
MNQQDLTDQLSARIDRQISTQIVKFYFEAKNAFYQNDYEKTLVKSGKFVEQICRGLHYISTGVVLTRIEVDQIVRTIENGTSQSDEIRIIIPRLMRAVYAF